MPAALSVILFATRWCGVATVPLWPASAQGDPETIGDFDEDTWRILGGVYAAHSREGGRTLAARGVTGLLHVFLPGTFTVPQQFSQLLKLSEILGLDTIGLDYGWAPAPDAARNAQCYAAGACQECLDNYHSVVAFGNGSDLISGEFPVFGHSKTNTLKFTHYYESGVQFLPTFKLNESVNITGPVPEPTREYIENITSEFNIQAMLVKVLTELDWKQYLAPNGLPLWSKIVISGHSQGASHAAYVAQQRKLHGAMAFSGPQDACGDNGAAWASAVPDNHTELLFACFATDEPGQLNIERNMNIMTQITRLDMENRHVSHGDGSWCAPPEHCATAVDDQLADSAIKQCFDKLRIFTGVEARDQVEQVGSGRRSARIYGSMTVLIALTLQLVSPP